MGRGRKVTQLISVENPNCHSLKTGWVRSTFEFMNGDNPQYIEQYGASTLK